MPKTVNPDPAWTDTLSVPLPHETMDADDVAVPDTRLLANDKWLRREFGARLDALERAVWPTSVQANLTATETDSAAHVWRIEYSLSTSRGTITGATLDFGDGTAALTLSNPGTPGAVTHDYPDTGGSYTAVLRVTTSEGAQETVERSITVASPHPALPNPTINIEPTNNAHGEYWLAHAGYQTAPSGNSITKLVVDWGDGSAPLTYNNQSKVVSGSQQVGSEPVQYEIKHTYAPGTYTAKVTATDQYGQTASGTETVAIADAPAPEVPGVAEYSFFATTGWGWNYSADLDTGAVTKVPGSGTVTYQASKLTKLQTSGDIAENSSANHDVIYMEDAERYDRITKAAVTAKWVGEATQVKLSGTIEFGTSMPGAGYIEFFDAAGAPLGSTQVTYDGMTDTSYPYERFYNQTVTVPAGARGATMAVEGQLTSFGMQQFRVVQ